MALFDRKRSSYESVAPLYTLGSSQTLLVVGLGNIGSEYVNTRHNLGFMVLDKYQTTHDFSGWTNKKDLKCEIATGQIGSTRVILVKPTTFMNNSGEAVQKIQKFYQIYNSSTLVIHDELDIDFGTIRSRTGGSSAGHNGIKSLSELLGDDYGRIRIGIGPKSHDKMDSADFVLQDFSKEQQELIPKIVNEVCNMIDERTTGQLPEHTITVSK
jgi:PTH1 family peptidyl-tRNA hydrolase